MVWCISHFAVMLLSRTLRGTHAGCRALSRSSCDVLSTFKNLSKSIETQHTFDCEEGFDIILVTLVMVALLAMASA
jgi:hypothetical protein